jgi:hypothetical protein
VYKISLIVSDPLPASVTQSFTVTVTNAAPKILITPPSLFLVHGKSISMPLSDFFIDDEQDPITMLATYQLNGGAVSTIPGGIFSVPTPFTIDVASVGLVDVGTYKISLSVSDSLATVTTSYTLKITNASPRLISTPLAVNAPLNSITFIDLSTNFKDDDDDPMTLTAIYSFNGGSWVTLPSGIMTLPNWLTVAIAPTQMIELGIYLITVTVSDSLAKVSSTFKISVSNTPPYFLSIVPADFTMRFNNTYVFFIPKFQDDEGNGVTVILDSIPAG